MAAQRDCLLPLNCSTLNVMRIHWSFISPSLNLVKQRRIQSSKCKIENSPQKHFEVTTRYVQRKEGELQMRFQKAQESKGCSLLKGRMKIKSSLDNSLVST